MKSWILWIGVALLIYVVFISIQNSHIKKENSELKQSNNLLEASKDSMSRKWNDDSKQWEYERQSFKAENKILEDYLKKNEKELYTVKKKYNAVVGIQSEAEVKIDTVLVTELDTVRDSRIANVKNEWYEANIISKPDSTSLKLRAYSYSTYAIDEKGKLVVTEKNPYIEQKNINSFYVQPPKQRKKNFKYWVGAIAGGLIVYGISK